MKGSKKDGEEAKIYITAVITLPNTGATIATGLAAVVTADGEVTVTPDGTPSNADGIFDLIITRPV